VFLISDHQSREEAPPSGLMTNGIRAFISNQLPAKYLRILKAFDPSTKNLNSNADNLIPRITVDPT